MKIITSTDNEWIRRVSRLKEKRGRDRQARYLVEGPNLVREALDFRAGVDFVLFCGDETGLSGELRELKRAAEKAGAESVFAGPAVFRRLSDAETPQGVIAVLRKALWDEEALFRKDASRPWGNILVLDRLQDPGNAGVVVRTADAAGYGGIVAVKGTADVYSPKAVRAAAGALFRLPVMDGLEASAALSMLARRNKTLVASAADGAVCVYDADLRRDIALIVGNEGNGLGVEFRRSVHLTVSIPMQRGAESINASVAASIFMFESLRQNLWSGETDDGALADV
jgi:TrmH family RNA methyltransferase